MNRAAVVSAGVALMVGGQAEAQRMTVPGPGAGYPPPGPVVRPPVPPAPVAGRWGSTVGGRWWGGVNAPGGWAAYRAPERGYRLPSYWLTPRFYVSDWQRYGFAPPPAGYYWTRYYDDAVLIDGRGEVQDTLGGVDWNRVDGGYRNDGYARDDRQRRDRNGVAGAVAGAVVGGVAGNVIAGRGDKLGGTLIGGGLGAAAGYAIGSGGRDHRGPPPPPGAGYREPYRGERVERRIEDHGPGPGYPPPPPYGWSSGDGRTTVTVTTSGGAAPVIYAPPPSYGYGYGAGVTTITVQTAPVVTTTTTEIVEDSVTYTRPVVRRAYHKRVVYCRPAPVHRWRPRAPRVMGS